MKKVAFTLFCFVLLMVCAAPVWADQCAGALPVGSATGCGAIITVTSVDINGVANGFNVAITVNGNPYDGVEDTLVGVVNNSGATLISMPLSSTATPGIAQFDGDGPCFFNANDCFGGATGYEGPNNTFTVTDGNHVTVNFFTPCDGTCAGIGPGASAWFALEGTPNSLTLVSEQQTVHFPTGTSTQTASFGNGGSANTFALTSTNVTNANGIDVTIIAHYVDSEFSTPGNVSGPNIADGVCEASTIPVSFINGVPQYAADDIDCRLAAGGFVFAKIGTGNLDQLVPHCPPYHNNQCVWYSVSTNAIAGTDYASGNWYDSIAWNTNPSLVPTQSSPPPNTEYPPGWNNQIQRFYDRPGTNASNAYVADITDFFNPVCNVNGCGDPGGGGHQLNLNDWVWGAVPNGFADTEETIVPVPGISPFPYIKGLPMLVSVELEKLNTETPDPNALTKPNAISVATTDSNNNTVQVQFPKGFPQTFSCVQIFGKCTGFYFTFISSAPYAKNTTYNMQISSDLFQQVNLKFVVK